MKTSTEQLIENDKVQNYMKENPGCTVQDIVAHLFESSIEDPESAFELAVKRGVLSEDLESDNYVGNFMYMNSKNDVDFFKHKDTRCYVTSKPSIVSLAVKFFS